MALAEFAQLDDTAVVLLELATGKRLCTAKTGKNANIVFSPTEATFATVGSDGVVRIHDAKSGKTLRQWRAWRKFFPHARHKPIAYSPDGKSLATGGDGDSATLWDPKTGTAIRRLESWYELDYLSFSPDGKHIACWEAHRVSLLDTATGKPHLALPGHLAQVSSVAAFAGGDRFASAGCDERVYIWDRRKAFPVETYRTTARSAEAISSQGADLFSFANGLGGALEVYRRTSPKRLAIFRTPYLWATRFSPDGKLLACGDNEATVHLYSLGGDKAVRRLTIPRKDKSFLFCNDVAFSLDGSHLAVACSDGNLRVCDVTKLRWVWTLDGGELSTPDGFPASLAAVGYDPTGLLLAARGEGKLIFWEAARGTLVRRIEQPDDLRPERSAVSFSPDGRYLACCEGRDAATLWEVRSGQVVRRFRDHEGSVVGVCFLDGGRQVLTASHDHTLLLWDRAIMRPGPATGGLEAMWKELLGTAEEAHASTWQMVRTPGSATFLAKRLAPIPRSEDHGLGKRIERWIGDLSAKAPATRETALNDLLANMDDAEGPILRAAKSATPSKPSPELDPLMKRVFERRHSPERLRADRALAVLEYLGTDEARKVLKGIADGAPGHWLTGEAVAALRRIEKK